MSYKIYPITGITLTKVYSIPVNTLRMGNSIFVDEVIFIPKEYIYDYIRQQGIMDGKVSYLNLEDAKEVLKVFPDFNTYAIVLEHINPNVDTYILRIAISFLYVAHFLYCKSSKNSLINGKCKLWDLGSIIFGDNSICYEYADIKIGTRKIDENDFDLTIPCFYSHLSETPSYKRRIDICSSNFNINANIDKYVEKLIPLLLQNNELSQKINSALNLLYYILPQTNLDHSILHICTILETILLDEHDNGKNAIKKMIAVRTACLVNHNGTLNSTQYMANWIKKFYELRCAFVHEGNISSISNVEDLIVLKRALLLAKYSVPFILESFIDNSICSVSDIRDLVKANAERCGIQNAFDFISDILILNNE